jgi:hypothetical protein
MVNRRHTLAIAGLVALVVAFLALRGSKPHSPVEAYKSSLRAQGEKLTFAELTAARAPAIYNSIHAVVAQVGILNNSWLSPGSLELRKAVAPGQAELCWQLPAPVSNNGARMSDWNQFSGEIARVEPQLALMREALRESELDAGPAPSIFGPRRVNFVAMRLAAQWLAAAAVSQLHEGHLEEALQNIEAMARLAKAHRDEYTLVSQMIRIAISGLGLYVTWEALQAPGWTDPQLARLQQAWEAISLLDSVETGFVGERAGGIEMWTMARGPKARQLFALFGRPAATSLQDKVELWFQQHLLLPLYKLTSIERDELFYLESMQAALVTIRSLKARQPWVEARIPQDLAITNLNLLSGTGGQIRYWLSSLAIPNYSRATETALRNETERQLTLAAISLARFRFAHGSLPQQLSQLSPEFLTQAPYDPMSGKALHYRPGPDGGFLLYSVGLDGIDNGGDPTANGSTNRFGFWDGRDAVWPSPPKRAHASGE